MTSTADAPTTPDDETAIHTTAVAAVPREKVWQALVERAPEWWAGAYLGDDAPPMQMEPRLGGRVWSGSADAATGDLHGTIRAFDPPERLEIGGVLVPGAYAGSISITLETTSLGCEVRVEQMARGRIDDATEERMSTGWTVLLASLTELADG